MATTSVMITGAMIDEWVKELTLADIVGDVRAPGYPDRLGNYQYTATGHLFWACDPREEEIHIVDIARQLSRICRFGGATKRFLSVAEHCWHCSYQVPPEHALAALLHDFAEAFIGDQIRPLKYLPIFGTVYFKFERGIETVGARKFGVEYPWSKEVKFADEKVLGVELRDNIVSREDGYLTDDRKAWNEGAAGKDIILFNWEPVLAEQYFLNRFYELVKARGLLAA